jgi:hypothetical protein
MEGYDLDVGAIEASGWKWPGVVPLRRAVSPSSRIVPLSKSEWGPPAWGWLHTLAISYPEVATAADAATARARIAFFLGNLPCGECRSHAAVFVAARPPFLGSSLALQAWVWSFHNNVNRRVGKPTITYDEYRRLYAEEIRLTEIRRRGAASGQDSRGGRLRR